jgi:1-deoxy-D-xylulose-5-phosphate synthase
VVFALDRAGLVGEDGPTHHGIFDLAYLRQIPNMVVSAPKDGNELKDLLLTALQANQPFALRYPRGKADFLEPERSPRLLKIGEAEIVVGTFGAPIVIWAIGSLVSLAMAAAQKYSQKVLVVNARFVKPLDKKLLKATALTAKKIITLEENTICGGFGSAILEALQELKINLP